MKIEVSFKVLALVTEKDHITIGLFMGNQLTNVFATSLSEFEKCLD